MKKSFCLFLTLVLLGGILALFSPVYAAPAAPAGNALLIKDRTSRCDTHSQAITAQLQLNGQGSYYVGNYIKLALDQSNVTYTIVLELFTDAAANNHTWIIAPSVAVNSSSYTLSEGIVNVTWEGNLTNAIFYGMSQQGAADVTYSYYVDSCSLKKQAADTTLGNELLLNPQMECDSTGIVLNWEAYSSAILESTIAYVPYPPEPSDNAMLVGNRTSRVSTLSQDVTSQVLSNGTGTYFIAAWVKLKDPNADGITYNIVTETQNTAGNYAWAESSRFVLSDTEWTLVSGTLTITYTGTLSYAKICGQLLKNGTAGNDSTAAYYIDSCTLRRVNGGVYGDELFVNPDIEYNQEGAVNGWTINGSCTLTPTTSFTPEILPTANGDGSITYANGFVPASDVNIKYIGRWQSDGNNYNGYWEGYAELKFTGTTVKVILASSAKLAIMIDGQLTDIGSVSAGSINLTTTPLSAGNHTVRLISREQGAMPKISYFQLDANASTLPKATKPMIEFIGDSITEGYAGPGYNACFYSYAWNTGELLEMDHNQIAFGGITMIEGAGSPCTSGMINNYFKLIEPLTSVTSNPAWDTSAYAPDYIVINLGTNDPAGNAAFQPTYINFLTQLRQAYPNTVIFAMRPFNGAFSSEINAAVQSRNSAGDNNVIFVDTTGWVTETADGLHPTIASGNAAAVLLADFIESYLDGSLTPSPSPTATPTAAPTATPTTTPISGAGAEETGDATPLWLTMPLLFTVFAGIFIYKKQKHTA